MTKTVCESCVGKLGLERHGKYQWDVTWAGKCGICGFRPTRENPSLTFLTVPMHDLTMLTLRNMVK